MGSHHRLSAAGLLSAWSCFTVACALAAGSDAAAAVGAESGAASGSGAAFHPGFDANDLASAGAVRALFLRWRAQHGKPALGGKEFSHRLGVFLSNIRKIEAHNSRQGSSFRMGLNQFSDLTTPEFIASFTGYGTKAALKDSRLQSLRGAKDPLKEGGDLEVEFPYRVDDVPEVMDWREKGAVSDVKNQGQCGSCWAFSATGAMESLNQIKTGSMVTVSEEELVDCDFLDGGCEGGWPSRAFVWSIFNRGLNTEAGYPYTATDGKCQAAKKKAHALNIGGYVRVPPSEWFLVRAVAHQPVSVCIDASPLHQYAGGIIEGGCEGELNHAVLAVGYGEANGTEYWVVKNSWGGAWGEAGYFRLKKGTPAPGTCGIMSEAVFPVMFHKDQAGDGKAAVFTS